MKQSTQVPCVATTDVIYMGHLAYASETEHLRKDAKMEIPLWLTKAIVGLFVFLSNYIV